MTAKNLSHFLRALVTGAVVLLCFNIGALLYAIITIGFGSEWSVGFDNAAFKWNGEVVGWPIGSWKAGVLLVIVTALTFVQRMRS